MRLPLPVLAAVSAAVLLAAPLLLAAPAAAQHRWIAPDFASPSASITERKLDAVAAAMTAMAMVKHGYRQMMASAAPADRQRLASEAQSALAKAVTDQGISLADFRGILEAAEGDAELRGKILKRLGVSGESEPGAEDDDPDAEPDE